MGTRNLICVFYRGRFVIAQYTQWDGYPEGEGQGMKILNFLLEEGNIERLRHGLQFMACLSYEQSQQLGQDGKLSAGEVIKRYPSLSRDTGAGILEMVAQATEDKVVPVMLDLEFANDGLFCEWAYVVDLDDGVFEVFSGSEDKYEGTNKRFADVGGPQDTVPIFIKSFSFTKLPFGERVFIESLNEAFGGLHTLRRRRDSVVK